jgi:hypothetical protein
MYTQREINAREMPPKKKHSDSSGQPTLQEGPVKGVRVGGHVYYRSTRPKKKLMVRVGDQWIHFGSLDYEHYHDRTGLLPKDLNHGDKARRESYLKRSKWIRDADGKLTAMDPTSANFHAIRILW